MALRFLHGATNMSIEITRRNISESELDRLRKGFEEYALEHGVPPLAQIRYGVVAMDGDGFVGCASGLADRRWFFLSDLWVEKEYRGHGTGTKLLQQMETKVLELGVDRIYTWTAGFEAPAFYAKNAYEVFGELENYYPTGHSRIGLRKTLGKTI